MKRLYTITSDAVIFFKNPFEPGNADTVAEALAQSVAEHNGSPRELAKVLSRAHSEGLSSYMHDRTLTEEEGLEVIQRLKRAVR